MLGGNVRRWARLLEMERNIEFGESWVERFCGKIGYIEGIVRIRRGDPVRHLSGDGMGERLLIRMRDNDECVHE